MFVCFVAVIPLSYSCIPILNRYLLHQLLLTQEEGFVYSAVDG